LENGKVIAASTYLESDLIIDRSETLHLNLLRFKQIPETLRRFEANRSLTENERIALLGKWPYFYAGPETIFAFGAPPSDLPKGLVVRSTGALHWPSFEKVHEIRTSNVIAFLLRSSLRAKCLSMGLVETHNDDLYFPRGLLPKDKVTFRSGSGGRTWIQVVGTRHHGNRPFEYHYYLSPYFRIRQDLQDPFTVGMKVHLYLTELDGSPLPHRTAQARRKKICMNWWNRGWSNRYLAVSDFISGGSDEIVIGNIPSEAIVIDARPIQLEAPFSIDEALLNAPVSDPEEPDIHAG
jgi:hypothetical protein